MRKEKAAFRNNSPACAQLAKQQRNEDEEEANTRCYCRAKFRKAIRHLSPPAAAAAAAAALLELGRRIDRAAGNARGRRRRRSLFLCSPCSLSLSLSLAAVASRVFIPSLCCIFFSSRVYLHFVLRENWEIKN